MIASPVLGVLVSKIARSKNKDLVVRDKKGPDFLLDLWIEVVRFRLSL